MKTGSRRIGTLAGAVAAIALFGPTPAAWAQDARPGRAVEVPAGTTLRVQLDQAVDTRTMEVGHAVSGALADPVIRGRDVLIPAGSLVTGRVTAIAEDEETIAIAFERIEIRGTSHALETQPAQLALRKRSEMRKEGAKIGGGAAAGAVVGGLVGGDLKGAAIGAVVGAAAGTGVALATKGHWGEAPAGSTVAAALGSPLRVPRAPRPTVTSQAGASSGSPTGGTGINDPEELPPVAAAPPRSPSQLPSPTPIPR